MAGEERDFLQLLANIAINILLGRYLFLVTLLKHIMVGNHFM